MNPNNYVPSCFHPMLWYLRFIGASYNVLTKRNKSLSIALKLYNLIIFMFKIFYFIVLLIGVQSNEGFDYRWTNITHYTALVICSLSIWSNILIHSIKFKFINECVNTSSVNGIFVEKKYFTIK